MGLFDFLDKIERRYGTFAWYFMYIFSALLVAILILLWVEATIAFVWPGVIPFVIAGWMTYKVLGDDE